MEPESISALMDGPLVIDCSVAINLAATGRASEIARAIPNRLVAERTVQRELVTAPQQGYPHAAIFAELIKEDLVEIVEMGEKALSRFSDLVLGNAKDTLDDGEAATIAYAEEHGLVAVIDERKAARVCAERISHLTICSTGDLLALRLVELALGRSALSLAVIAALKEARMRVLPHREEWVLDLIGAEEVLLCKSLSKAVRLKARLGLS